ncbi:fucose 4-O-acetylase-like acetyltransferase [Streptomyces sp. B3I7]|uniref:acyltransferase family protein n=1 Tax=Streptomyces sp. B3I7 TaxID=3042269 RepID=UPI002781CCB7|nr:acyltransferase family protein [Streptomyces sp. B3I7]MDQ0814925.1 fucose 4-O-acetylase-like acetyltransferase [Streptomyces sp. B3I7]
MPDTPQATHRAAPQTPESSPPVPTPTASQPSPPPRPPAGRTAPGAPPSRTPAGPRGRDPFFDNAKYLTIVLVACGHAWEPLTYGSRAVHAVYLAVYAFHMPAFAMISGYFSRSFDMAPGRLKRLVTGVVVPYLVFETAYTLFYRWAQDDPGYPLSLLDPWYVMWFLVALFIWRLTTPLWLMLRHPLPVALGLAMLAACSPDLGGDLSIQRVLGFLPYFVLGLTLRPSHFERLRTRRARLLALPVAATVLAAAYWAAPSFDAGWLYHRGSVTGQGAPAWAGLLSTPALFLLAVVLTACFLAWVPRRHRWFTTLGAGTMYGYLLHGFLIKSSRFWGWYDHPWLHTPAGELAVTALAVGMITALCAAPVRAVFRYVVEPRMNWAFVPRPAATGPDRDRPEKPAVPDPSRAPR